MKNALLFALLAVGTTLTFASVNATAASCTPLPNDPVACDGTKGGDKGKKKTETAFVNDCGGCGGKEKTKDTGKEKKEKSE